MTKFRITYRDPETDEMKSVEREFEDWTGRAENEDGTPFGPVMTITAEEWAHDLGYSLADKGWFEVKRLS